MTHWFKLQFPSCSLLISNIDLLTRTCDYKVNDSSGKPSKEEKSAKFFSVNNEYVVVGALQIRRNVFEKAVQTLLPKHDYNLARA